MKPSWVPGLGRVKNPNQDRVSMWPQLPNLRLATLGQSLQRHKPRAEIQQLIEFVRHRAYPLIGGL